MTRRDEQEGLSVAAVRLLGFDVLCRCGHEEGLHEVSGRCAQFDCECTTFRADK